MWDCVPLKVLIWNNIKTQSGNLRSSAPSARTSQGNAKRLAFRRINMNKFVPSLTTADLRTTAELLTTMTKWLKEAGRARWDQVASGTDNS